MASRPCSGGTAWPGTLSLPDLLGDEHCAASWTKRDGSRWTALFFKWDAGPPRSRILARLHRPENCLPAAGYKLQADRGDLAQQSLEILIFGYSRPQEADDALRRQLQDLIRI